MTGSRKWFLIGIIAVVILGVVAFFVIRQRQIALYDPARFFPAPSKSENLFYVNLPDYKKFVKGVEKSGLLKLLPEKDRPKERFFRKSCEYVSRLSIAVYFEDKNRKEFFFVTPKISLSISSVKKILKVFYPSIKIMKEAAKIHGKKVYKVQVKGRKSFWGVYYSGSFVLAKKLEDMKWILDRALSKGKKLVDCLPHKVKGNWYLYLYVGSKNTNKLSKKAGLVYRFTGGIIEAGISQKESGMIVVDTYFTGKGSKKLLVDFSKDVNFIVQMPMLKKIILMLAARLRGDVMADIVEHRISQIPNMNGKNPYEIMGVSKKDFIKLFTGGLLLMIGDSFSFMNGKYPEFMLIVTPDDKSELSTGVKLFTNVFASTGLVLQEKKAKGWSKLYTAISRIPVFVGIRGGYVVMGVGKPSALHGEVGVPRQVKSIYKNARGSIVFVNFKEIKKLVEKLSILFKLENEKGYKEFITVISKVHWMVAFLKGKNRMEIRIIP